MNWIATAGTTAVAVAIAHHLGLVTRVAEVFREICGCPHCSVFWAVLAALILTGTGPVAAVAAAIGYAYMTDWLGLLLNELASIYDRLWEKQKRNHSSQDR